MGPFSITGVIQAPPEPRVKGLILLSHGTAGSELGHSSLAEAFAQRGYLVAALRHPGDNFQDPSLRDGTGSVGARYFTQRPLQVSHVIDALRQDPLGKDRVASGSKGPRIGAVGRSAGGYTVLVLAGGEVDMAGLASHCTTHRADDSIFCQLTRTATAGAAPIANAFAFASASASASAPAVQAVADPRVRAVVAMSPASLMFTPDSLARITVPTLPYRA